jgi:hypothetical protein
LSDGILLLSLNEDLIVCFLAVHANLKTAASNYSKEIEPIEIRPMIKSLGGDKTR